MYFLMPDLAILASFKLVASSQLVTILSQMLPAPAGSPISDINLIQGEEAVIEKAQCKQHNEPLKRPIYFKDFGSN